MVDSVSVPFKNAHVEKMLLNIRMQWIAGTACVSECVLNTLACRGLRVGPSKDREKLYSKLLLLVPFCFVSSGLLTQVSQSLGHQWSFRAAPGRCRHGRCCSSWGRPQALADWNSISRKHPSRTIRTSWITLRHFTIAHTNIADRKKFWGN